MTTKFEQLLDFIVNEEMEKANELFHEIVVEKSREIYENLIAQEAEEELDVEEGMKDEDVEEGMKDEDVEEDMEKDDVEESYEDSENVEMETAYTMDGDDSEAGDDMMSTGDATDDLEAEVGAEGDTEELAQDIDANMDELQSLWQELSAKLGVEGGEDEFGSDDMSGDDMGGDEMPGDDMDNKEGMGFMEGRRLTREYVEKVGTDWDKGSTMKSQGQYVGAGSGDKEGAPVEGKSPIANLKKPSVGDVRPHNIAQGHAESAPDGTKPHGKAGGFLSNPKEDNAGNGNVPGGKMGVGHLKKVAGGHGAEKKGAGPGPVGSGSGDKAGQTSMGSTAPILKPLK